MEPRSAGVFGNPPSGRMAAAPAPMAFWRHRVIDPALRSGVDREIEGLQAQLDQRPDSARTWFGLGSLHHVRGDRKEALACYLRSIDCEGCFPAAHVAAGRLYAVEGNLDRAWHHARQAERLGDASLVEQLSRYLTPPAAPGR